MENQRFNLASHLEELGACCQEAVQTPGGNCIHDKGESSHYPRHSRKTGPDRAYSDSFRLTSSKQTRHQHISDQQSPLFIITGTFQEHTRTKGEKQAFFQPEEERVIPHYPKAFQLGERITQKP
ncbi:hypothetical protein O181_109895 [Austropuccinia psidii MF-1]|uniref:Uncharacterized protein n=1 Tax=Austropuccinia psidii MF-1 TaxID=1389203 RepID=A0A9Q3JVA4_9BASI|nr:hypothetical protein [Austropuccinia psidii MF-1]